MEEMKMPIYKREFSFPNTSNKNEKDDDEDGDKNVMRCHRRVSNQLRHLKISKWKEKKRSNLHLHNFNIYILHLHYQKIPFLLL